MIECQNCDSDFVCCLPFPFVLLRFILVGRLTRHMFNPGMTAIQHLPSNEASKFSKSCHSNVPQGLLPLETR
ncbi:MAG: hypothetical protein NXI28_25235 [bacterium]|nr:hypothetical protein [bacterium]